jgi:CTP synthase (UTP-ammonia lyase)
VSRGIRVLQAALANELVRSAEEGGMGQVVRIALVGDFDPVVIAHQAIPQALHVSAGRLGVEVTPTWIHTASIDPSSAERLSEYSAVWCVPGSPYASMNGALLAIRSARELLRPFLGTCGGFQHAILEYVRNVLRHAAADHAETSPDAVMPVISHLSCSLVERTGKILLRDGSRLREIYGAGRADEEYHCNFGLNPEYARLFTDPSGLCVAANDCASEVRAVELAGHPFFVATLFQPERSGLRGIEHPLVTAFVAAARRA